MDLLVWSHTYSVGSEEIDKQHKKIMELLNSLHNANQAADAKNKVGSILDELVNYTVYHFGTEEEMFARLNYSDGEYHTQIHKKLIAEVQNFLEMMKANEESAKEKLMVFLTDWLKDHILGDDKKFGNYLKTHLATEEPEDDL
jgi:hemerythrin-like metal-binding protein